jgi:hypothetical protein
MTDQELLSFSLRAICLTRDYVGESLLPAIQGWDWFDAGTAIAQRIPDDPWAEQFHLRVNADCQRRLNQHGITEQDILDTSPEYCRQ